jgi:hypothetical protein
VRPNMSLLTLPLVFSYSFVLREYVTETYFVVYDWYLLVMTVGLSYQKVLQNFYCIFLTKKPLLKKLKKITFYNMARNFLLLLEKTKLLN